MDVIGLIKFLFGYFGVPIIALAIMISITVSFGIMSGSISAAILSLYALVFIKLMGEPVKCKLCLVIKTFVALSAINIILTIFTSGFFDKENSLNTFSLSILPSIFLVIVFIVIVWYLFHRFTGTSPRLLKIVLRPFRILFKPLRKILLKIKTYDQACFLLNNAYNRASHKYPPKTSAINNFIWMSKKIATETQFRKDLTYRMALYTSHLLVKCFVEEDYKTSKKLFYNYANNLYPNVGGCDFQTNIIGNSLNLAINTDDKKIAAIIFDKLLGKDFKMDDIPHDGVLFNLACYYSLHGEKEKMLEAIHFSLKNGHEKSGFLKESDFKHHWEDRDFLNIIAEGD